MGKVKKGVRLEHISKIYQDPKTGKDFYAVKDTSLEIEPGSKVLWSCFDNLHGCLLLRFICTKQRRGGKP